MHERNQIKRRGALSAASGFFKSRPLAVAGLVAVVAFGFVGVSYTAGNNPRRLNVPRETQGRSPSDAAIEQFWAIYHGNEYDAIPQAQKQLEDAVQGDPDNPTLYALLGATHFWHVGESARDTNQQQDQYIFSQDMSTAASLFEKALNLDYYSPHLIGYVNDDHLPGYWGITTVHSGQQRQDSDVIAKGDSILDFAVYQFPEFNNFNRWAAHNTDPKDSDTYKKALDSLWQAIDACIGTQIDRANPDMKPYLQLVTSVGRKKACWWEGDIAPYGFEGLTLNLGNGLVKAGQVDAAKVMYANARYASNYVTWPYRKVLETIAASDLNARAEGYADGDSGNDPPLGVPDRSCVYCHATVPEPATR